MNEGENKWRAGRGKYRKKIFQYAAERNGERIETGKDTKNKLVK